ncbi:hypothetical protein BJ546DRAFT_1092172 [Cryomyces antarcticus]
MSLDIPSITIFTNGSVNGADKAVADALAITKAKGVTLDERKIAQLDDAGDEGVDIVFEDGFTSPCHFPWPDSLVKRNDPFGETNVKGVFVAGDAGTLLKQIMGHMAQGATADAVIHIQLCQQEIERVMANLKSMEVEDVKVKEMEKEPEVLFK